VSDKQSILRRAYRRWQMSSSPTGSSQETSRGGRDGLAHRSIEVDAERDLIYNPAYKIPVVKQKWWHRVLSVLGNAMNAAWTDRRRR